MRYRSFNRYAGVGERESKYGREKRKGGPGQKQDWGPSPPAGQTTSLRKRKNFDRGKGQQEHPFPQVVSYIRKGVC